MRPPALLCLLPLFCFGCLRPTEERARRDQEIGQAERDEYSVRVAGGHAAVRHLGPDSALLWGGAPRLEIEVDFSSVPPDRFLLDVNNCMPEARLTTRTPGVGIQHRPRFVPTECRFEITELPADGAIELVLAVEDADRAAPFRFAVLSDVQEAIDEVHDIYALLNREPDVDFLLGAGDLTQRGTVEQLEYFQRELTTLDIPYFTTLGNHELGVSPPPFQDYFGRANFSFTHRGVRFTLLDSGSASVDPLVYKWLDGWLAAGAEEPHVVAMHIPPLDPVGVRNGAFASRNEAAKLLARLAQGGVDLTLYGHIHSYYKFDNAGIRAYISGGGGAIPERFDGIGRHFLVIDVDPNTEGFETRIVRVD